MKRQNHYSPILRRAAAADFSQAFSTPGSACSAEFRVASATAEFNRR
ncbi:MAG: hypothetical protein ACKVZH_25315 [Blastocatellia bacterium]